MLSLARLQEYLRFKAGQHHEVVSLLAFDLFFHATDPNPVSNNEQAGHVYEQVGFSPQATFVVYEKPTS